MKKALVCFLLFLTGYSYAQLEAYRWYFSETDRGLTFDFLTGLPVVTTEHVAPLAIEGNGVANDPITGDLMFYIGVDKVFDKTHSPMPNGGWMLNSSSCAQKNILCPVPGNCNQYYIFQNTSAREDMPGTFYYSVVDMSLQGNGTMGAPLGDVVVSQLNVFLKSNTGEAACLIKSTSSDVYWLIVSTYDAVELCIYRIDASGINLSSTYNVPYAIDDYRQFNYSYQSQKMVLTSNAEIDPTLLFDFDRGTGTITGVNTIPGTPLGPNLGYWTGMFGSEWSADGTKLYLGKYRWVSATTGGWIYQYDLNTPLNPILPVFVNGGGYNNVVLDLKRAPNGEIYFIYNDTINGYRFLGEISNPNNAGTACNVIPQSIDLGIDIGMTSKFSFHLPENLPPVATNDTILTTCVQMTDYNIPLNILDPDDNLFSITFLSIPPGITATATGNTISIDLTTVLDSSQIIYYVACDVDCYPKCDSSAIILLPPVSNVGSLNILGNDTSLCLGDSLLLSPGITSATYIWQDSSASNTFEVNSGGTYHVDVFSNNCHIMDTILVTFNSSLPLDLGSDTSFCEDVVFTITAPTNFNSYQWNTGSSAQQITPDTPGTYSLLATDSNGCTSIDTLVINDIYHLPLIDLGGSVQFCGDSGVYITPILVSSNVAFAWNTGATSSTMHTNAEGSYSVIVTNIFGCSSSDSITILSNCPPILFIPDAFTPNQDEINSFFKAYGDYIQNFEMEIYNRWGQLIHTIHDLSGFWDGTYNGQPCPIGVYLYKVRYNGQGQLEQNVVGRVSLLR